MGAHISGWNRWWTSGVAVGVLGLAGTVSAQAPADPIVPEAPIISEAVVVEAPAVVAPDTFKNVPTPRPAPRMGSFPIPPTGPGAYSLLDALRGEELAGPPKYPYPRFGLMAPSFFDADFRYLDDPKNTECDFYDPLKRIRVGDNWMFSTGGSLWNRYMSEGNSRLGRTDNDYNLTRARVYGDLWYRDQVRFYAEFLGGFTSGQELAPLPIDQNRGDFLNLFVDLKIGEWAGKPAYLRVGRQELLLGSQRLISPLEWANTRRTFQGVRAFHQGEKVDVDLFWVQPVNIKPSQLDDRNTDQNLAGVYTTTRPAKGQAVDLYYLYTDNAATVTQQRVQRAPNVLNTFGGRYVGDKDGEFLWDFEAAMQLGALNGQKVAAGMATAGLGYHFKDAPLNPTFWAYYDYASGDNSPNVGRANTFNQLFPFGHYYLGWADQVGRQNIHDFNLHMYLYPTKWLTAWVQYHNFWLAAKQDALYNAAGNAIRRDATGNAGSHVGQEIDLVLNFHLSKHADLLTGYSHLYGGDFLRNTAGATGSANTSLYYLQVNYRW